MNPSSIFSIINVLGSIGKSATSGAAGVSTASTVGAAALAVNSIGVPTTWQEWVVVAAGAVGAICNVVLAHQNGSDK